jgi:hypothetical protein
MIELRPEVQAFAEAMELKLRENDNKGGWKKDSPVKLFMRAKREFLEADDALSVFLFDVSEPHTNQVLAEFADVANFLMMIADNCGLLVAKE